MRKAFSLIKGAYVPHTTGFLSPPIRVNGGFVISVRGSFQTVMTYAALQEWNPRNIVAFGQNGSVSGIQKSELEAHMVVVIGDRSLADVSGSIDKTILDALMQDGFDYANMIAGFHNGVQLVNFGEAFAVNPFGEWIMKALFKTFFTHAMILKNSDDLTNALLLIGQGGDRTLCAKISGRDGTFKMLPSPFDQVVESRHAVVGKNILLTTEFGQNSIYGVEAESLVLYLTDPEGVLVWAHQNIGHGIEDFAVIDGSCDAVILTLANSEFRLLPMIVRFQANELEFRPSTLDGIRLSDLDGEILSPVVRIARNGQVILADRHSGSTLVRFDHPSTFGSKFEQMVISATTHRLFAHRMMYGA